ncbi:hypothetical protein AL755_09335 [Arthrobacter sp. ERGS1:01]|uniref:universal stress protein n=1 Tax=Arthrobacter sp. ERGS1:01 TaxID=1704044 RepID=UPI0006B63ADA|nr:universal stress protein [Arthrobacter sp. ERGS1:01]ALE05635.1 hypothetical protein AL755_09335 [Arthrobacter sp. ERGS1:01]
MSTKHPIFVGVDQSASSRAALEWGARRAESLHLALLLVHVIPDYLVSPGNLEYQNVKDAIAGLLESEAIRARELAPSSEVQTKLMFGETVPVLAQLSGDAAMVVVGTDRTADGHGEGFGAVTLQIAMVARCPVAVIPAHYSAAGYAGVVVGIDGSAHSTKAANFAAAEALSGGSELTLIHASRAHSGWLSSSTVGPRIAAWDETAGRMILETAVTCLRAHYIHLTVCDRLETGDGPAKALIDAAQGAQLLVVGSRGSGAVQHALMGSVTQDVLLHVPCPLILTRPAKGT